MLAESTRPAMLHDVARAIGWPLWRVRRVLETIEDLTDGDLVVSSEVGIYVDLDVLVSRSKAIYDAVAARRRKIATRYVPRPRASARSAIYAELDAHPNASLADLLARLPSIPRNTIRHHLVAWRRERGRARSRPDVAGLFEAHVAPYLAAHPRATIAELERLLPTQVTRASLVSRVTAWRRRHGYLSPREKRQA